MSEGVSPGLGTGDLTERLQGGDRMPNPEPLFPPLLYFTQFPYSSVEAYWRDISYTLLKHVI